MKVVCMKKWKVFEEFDQSDALERCWENGWEN